MIAPMRLVFALLTTFCLLFQQVAVAATACLMEFPPAASAATSGHCDEMDPVKESAALCKSHCAPDHAVLTETKWPPLPFVAMLPPKPDFKFVQALPEQGVPSLSPVHRSDPPARLRYCRLLI